MRLNKFLAKAGVIARRKCEQYIFSGMVYVNGKKIVNPSYKVDEKKDEVFLNNKRIVLKKKYRYIVLNKPQNCVTTLNDEKGRNKVIDYVDVKERLYPVGRLDIDTTGVLLLTNDGEIAYRLSHPKFEVKKEYIAVIDKRISENIIEKIEKGVAIGKDEVVNGEIEIINNKSKGSEVKIIIHCGRKRQIKRMFNVLGYKVLELDRTSFAGIKKGSINPGEWRELSNEEIDSLKKVISSTNICAVELRNSKGGII